jgi:hypothetical protein
MTDEAIDAALDLIEAYNETVVTTATDDPDDGSCTPAMIVASVGAPIEAGSSILNWGTA